MHSTRRELLVRGTQLGAAFALTPSCTSVSPVRDEAGPPEEPLYRISLAQWSLHRTLRAGELEALDFPRFTKDTFGIDAVEYVNSFFFDKAADFAWLAELKSRAADAGVQSLLIMIDGEGRLATAEDAERRRAIEKHFKWIAAASFLGCHAIRVNAAGDGDWDWDMARAADSLHRLGLMGDDYGVDVIVENHGGLSSNGEWLAGVMERAGHPRVGTLPDFGNFHLGDDKWYDRYQGVRELMPYARAVSAKSHEFDEAGDEVRTDYRQMMRIVLDAGYRGHVGVEWEGGEPDEVAGIRATQRLLEKVRDELAGEYATTEAR